MTFYIATVEVPVGDGTTIITETHVSAPSRRAAKNVLPTEYKLKNLKKETLHTTSTRATYAGDDKTDGYAAENGGQ